MEKEDRETLRHISITLDEMLAVMKKPENKFEKAVYLGSAIVGGLAVFETIDFIVKMIGG